MESAPRRKNWRRGNKDIPYKESTELEEHALIWIRCLSRRKGKGERSDASRERKRTDDSSSLRNLKLHLADGFLGDDESCSNVDAHDEIKSGYGDVLDGNSRRSLTSVLEEERMDVSALSSSASRKGAQPIDLTYVEDHIHSTCKGERERLESAWTSSGRIRD